MNYEQAHLELAQILNKGMIEPKIVIAYMQAKNTEMELSKISSNLASIVTAINSCDGERKIVSELEAIAEQVERVEEKI